MEIKDRDPKFWASTIGFMVDPGVEKKNYYMIWDILNKLKN